MPLDRLLRPPLRRLLVIWLVSALVIGLAAYGIFMFARREVVQHQWGLLEAIADDREAAIAGWINDRRDEALRFLDNPAYTEVIARLLAHKQPGVAWPFLQRDIDVLLNRPHYEAVALLTPDGEIAHVFGASIAAFDALPSLSFSSTERVSFHAIIVGEAPHREVRIVMVAPLWSGDRTIGTLAFAIQPYLEVGPVLTTWPWPDSTVEVLVFQRRADEILYLTAPRYSPEAVLVVKVDPALLATQAMSRSGRLQGLDYQENRAVGVARGIGGTPWHLLVKIDSAELHGLIKDLGLFAGALTLLLMGLAGLLVYSRFYQLQAQHRSALLQAEVDKQTLSRRFDYLAKYANDMIVLADKDGRILEVNDRAIGTYGYTRDEFLSRSLLDLAAPEEVPSLNGRWATLQQQRSAIFEVLNKKKNGDRFFVECSFRLIDIRGETFVQDIMRDISERKKAEARIRKLNRLYLTLSHTNEAILYSPTDKDLLVTACDIAVSDGSFVAAWTMTVSTDGHYLDMLTFRGPGENEFRGAMKPPTTEISRGATVSTLAIREGRSIYINDYLNDPRMATMQDWASRNCVGSAAAFPIYVEGRPYGVIGVCAAETNAFDDEVVSLLERMASDISYAIRNLRQSNALAESEERLSQVFRATRDCYWDIRFDLNMVYFSPYFRKRFDLPAESLTIDDAAAFFVHRIHTDDLSSVVDEADSFLRGACHRTVSDCRIAMADGRERWVQVKGQVVRRGEGGAPQRIAGVVTDITEQRRTNENMQYWERVFRDSRESIVILNRQRRILSVNKAFTTITGYSAKEALGNDLIFLSTDANDKAELQQAWEVLMATGHWQGELRGRRKDGEAFSYWVAGSRVTPSPGAQETYVTISTDLTESKSATERIRFLSHYDGLTGLPNRQLFHELLDQAISHAQRKGTQLAVLFFDIDRFKNVNDSLGYAVGDLLIKELAQRLTKTVAVDETVSRQGGDDFVVLLTTMADANSVVQTAMDLLNAASRPFVIHGNEINLTASIGIAIYPIDGTDSDTLIKNADTAMYYSKEHGSNNFKFFFNDLNARARRRLSLATELRRAVDHGEFELHYQPQVETTSGKFVGLESLIRWPRRGQLVLPGEFIPMAEELGLIVPIGEWVVQAACRQRQGWTGSLGKTLLAINLSALQFREKGVIQRLAEVIADQCESQSIEFELTESVVMHDAEESIKIFRSLKERGVRLALDDFGTGYSSLNYLRRFPIDRIKVDKSFIHNLPSESSNRTITEAIIGLSKGLGITVLAEGVETEAELALLKASGCDQVQGFYIAPPLTSQELAAWWRQRSPGGVLSP